MPELPTITPADPVVIPEITTPAKTYDKMRLVSLVIQGFDLNKDADAFCELQAYRDADDGSYEAAPGPSTVFKIEGLNALAANDSDLAMTMGMVLNMVIKFGKEQNLLA